MPSAPTPLRHLPIVLLLVLAAPDTTRADTPWHFYGAGSTGWTAGKHSGGLTFDGMGLVGFHILDIGLAVQAATHIFGSMLTLSALGGVGLELDLLRLGLWAETGLHHYTSVGSNFLTHDPGIDALIPFAGGRAHLAVRIARTRTNTTSIWLGLTGIRAIDLTEIQGHSLYTNGNNGVVTRPHRAGQTSWTLLGSLGVSLNL